LRGRSTRRGGGHLSNLVQKLTNSREMANAEEKSAEREIKNIEGKQHHQEENYKKSLVLRKEGEPGRELKKKKE